MKQLHYILIFSFLYFQITLSQNKDTDKLLANIEHSDYQDTVRVQDLNKLCNLLSNYDTKKALNFGNQCLILARKLNYRKGEAEAFNNLGIAYDKIDLSKQAINYLFKANDKLFKQIWANYIKKNLPLHQKKSKLTRPS